VELLLLTFENISSTNQQYEVEKGKMNKSLTNG